MEDCISSAVMDLEQPWMPRSYAPPGTRPNYLTQSLEVELASEKHSMRMGAAHLKNQPMTRDPINRDLDKQGAAGDGYHKPATILNFPGLQEE